ncbi:MAG: nucleotidyl transferase AbiEii/AbiGii toxin family protein [Peptostreptococcaceae bacterium]|nr:nucleotidyl transferase AbiEii/AbiGii toxin family protein [Peptostreptococcaceae bacterium]
MNEMLQQMLKAYEIQTLYDQKNALKEIMQEIVLCGLSRAGFFKEAAFYGGTALRIFYGLDRFSEDLDFSLATIDLDFKMSDFFPVLQKEIRSFGLNVGITEKEKTKDSTIRSAFLKANTREHLLMLYADKQAAGSVANNEIIKIKFEVDVSPPKYATFERKYRLLPVPYEVNLYDLPSLFAGKIHAVLARAWRGRIKGRDLYDYVFYLSRGTAVNLPHLRERLIDSGHIDENKESSLDDIKQMLCERFDSMDFAQAKQDVSPFIRDVSKLDLWGADFFKQITENLNQQ